MPQRHVNPEYKKLSKRINRFPQGAPPKELLFEILKVLFTEKEASLVAQLPIKPFSVKKAADIWKTDVLTAQKYLDALADKALILDLDDNGEQSYVLPPPMAGFFEFSLMRTRSDIDQKALAELFYQYINVDEDFVRDVFVTGGTPIVKVFVNETVLPDAVHILDYERASEVIKRTAHRAVGLCYCRHKMQHNHRACKAPLDICMAFGNSAYSLAKHGFAREVGVSECLDLLAKANDLNLVQCAENVREGVNFICNCCACCCEALIVARKFGLMRPVNTTNFIPEIKKENCNGCGKCAKTCPVEAITMLSSIYINKPDAKVAELNDEVCLGCGICAKVCPNRTIEMKSREQRVIMPKDSVHKAVLMAIERGKLQNLLFDNRALFSHRAMSAVLGVIFKLPPAKQILASKQLKSKYLEKMLSVKK